MHGYTHDKDGYLRRLRRIEDQVRGLQRMIDEDKYCIDILTQVAAATKALQSVAHGLGDAVAEGLGASAAVAPPRRGRRGGGGPGGARGDPPPHPLLSPESPVMTIRRPAGHPAVTGSG